MEDNKCDECKGQFSADNLYPYEEAGASQIKYICEDCLSKIFTKGGFFYARQK